MLTPTRQLDPLVRYAFTARVSSLVVEQAIHRAGFDFADADTDPDAVSNASPLATNNRKNVKMQLAGRFIMAPITGRT